MTSLPSSTYDTGAQSLDLLSAFQSRFGPSSSTPTSPFSTGVLTSASFIAFNAIDIHISMLGVRSAAASLYTQLKKAPYNFATWHAHKLHPSVEEFGEEGAAMFVFVMDALNFCFWSDGSASPGSAEPKAGEEGEISASDGFAIEYHGELYTGYWSLVAALRRAIEEGVPITVPEWLASEACSLEAVERMFRSAGREGMPLLRERWEVLKEIGEVLCDSFDGSVINLVESANHSATSLINTLTTTFPSFNDTHIYEDTAVRFHKRAQIFVADLWACFEGKGVGRFDDVDEVTMFADYRIPQILHTLHCLEFSPPLYEHIRAQKEIPSGSNWEIELRGTSVWAVELLRREIERLQEGQQKEEGEEKEEEADGGVTEEGGGGEEELKINAILIDFFLYDMVKALEKEEKEEAMIATSSSADKDAEGDGTAAFERREMIPHHRTRSIWY